MMPFIFRVGMPIGAAILLAACTTMPSSFAQGGSTGGTIGKHEKSASGGEGEQAPSRRVSSSKRRQRASSPSFDGESTRQQKGCGSFFGTWTSGGGAWLYGPNDTVIRANGTARHTSGIVGVWTCNSGEIVLEWKNWTTDRLKLSADGNRLDSVEGGKGFTR